MEDREKVVAIVAAIVWTGQAASKEPEYMSTKEAVDKADDIVQEAEALHD